jgi:hypothetical protein
MHYILLTDDPCKGVCPNTCPKQLGDSCGGLGNMYGTCDKQWLICDHRDNKVKNPIQNRRRGNHPAERRGRCRERRSNRSHLNRSKRANHKKHSYNRNQGRNKKQHKREAIQKRKSARSLVPMCENMEGKKTCKCKDPKSNTKLIETLPMELKWCFLEQVNNPMDPTKHCFEDVKWSKTDGRFWSYLAYRNGEESGDFCQPYVLFNICF